jgi:hypothetical protein
MRKHVAWYVKGLPHCARVRDQVNRTRTVEEMTVLLRGYIDELERFGPGAFAEPPTPGFAPDRPADEPGGAHAAG